MPSRWKRLIVSCFILLNIATIVCANLPAPVGVFATQWLDDLEHYSPLNAFRVKHAAWRWRQYGYNAGIDNRWQMFGYQSRFNWWYDIRAVYSDGLNQSAILLPLPNQSARSVAERFVFDLKERKFELNLYGNAVAREAYARYLARQYPTHDGLPIKRIRWYLGSQMILPPDEALAKHKLYADQVQLLHLNDFEVGSSEETRLVRLFSPKDEVEQ